MLGCFDPIVRLHQRGFFPRGILDVGAHDGVFAGRLRMVWPGVRMMLFEANPAMGPKLAATGLPYRICLLGRADGEADFYVDKSNEESTGNSMFLEWSHHFEDPVVRRLPVRRLDDVVDDPGAYDFMKLDVQGAELEVLAGAPRTLEAVRCLFVEVSLHECNRGAPLFYDVHACLHGLGFRMVDAGELVVVGSRMLQMNALFERGPWETGSLF